MFNNSDNFQRRIIYKEYLVEFISIIWSSDLCIMFCVRTIGMMWCVPNHRNVQDVCIQCHADELTNVHDMMRSEPYLRIQRISTSKPLHAPSSAMRLMDNIRERCNQKTTCIMPCVWDHAHDVMRQEPEQCFTVDILLNVSIRVKIMDSNRSASCCMYEIMRINDCVVEHRTVQRVNQLFYSSHVALILFLLWYCAMYDS